MEKRKGTSLACPLSDGMNLNERILIGFRLWQNRLSNQAQYSETSKTSKRAAHDYPRHVNFGGSAFRCVL